tara:strand:+ start:1947 stop:2123 length:177 start_codon:yes stop_codon:yes gene_type:complete
MGEIEMYERYIQELNEHIDVLEKRLSIATQVLTEIKERDNSPFGKIAEAVLSEIAGVG